MFNKILIMYHSARLWPRFTQSSAAVITALGFTRHSTMAGFATRVNHHGRLEKRQSEATCKALEEKKKPPKLWKRVNSPKEVETSPRHVYSAK